MRELEWVNINYGRHIYDEDGPFDFDKYINPESVDYIEELVHQSKLDYLKDNFGIVNEYQANNVLNYILQRQSKLTLNIDELVEEYNQLFGFEAMLNNPAREFIWGYLIYVDGNHVRGTDLKPVIEDIDRLNSKYGHSIIQRACSYDSDVTKDINISEDERMKLLDWVYDILPIDCKDDYLDFICHGRYLNFLLGCYSYEPTAEWEQRCLDFATVIINNNSHPSDIRRMSRLKFTQGSLYPAALRTYFEPYILMNTMAGV